MLNLPKSFFEGLARLDELAALAQAKHEWVKSHEEFAAHAANIDADVRARVADAASVFGTAEASYYAGGAGAGSGAKRRAARRCLLAVGLPGTRRWAEALRLGKAMPTPAPGELQWQCPCCGRWWEGPWAADGGGCEDPNCPH